MLPTPQPPAVMDAMITAPVPVPPVTETIGVEVYALPGLVRVTVAIEPVVDNAAVAVAPVPVGSLMTTVGAVEYPLPAVTVIAVIAPPVTVAVAVAPEPPPPDNVTVGLV